VINSQARRNLIARDSGEHSHDFAQILIGWRGQIDCEFSSGSSRLDKGLVGLVPNGAEHLFNGLTDNSELLVVDVVLDDPYILALEQACDLSFSDTLFNQPEFVALSPEMLPLLEFSAGQLQVGQAPINALLNCQLVSLFMTQLCQSYSPDIVAAVTSQRFDVVRLNELIDHRLAHPPSNAELASALHLSESHFYCIFGRQFAVTPQQYVMSRRMLRAKFLLLNSQTPLAVLANELGFADPSSFSRAYKKYFQQPPGRVRRGF